MTEQEALKILKNLVIEGGDKARAVIAVSMAIKALEQPKADWIPCEERLPIGDEYRKLIDGLWYYQHMLVTTNDVDIPMQVGWYCQEDECWYDQDGFVFYPIAWQPLPEPYKEGDTNENT